MDTIYKIFRDEQKRVKRNAKQRERRKRHPKNLLANPVIKQATDSEFPITQDEVMIGIQAAVDSETKEVSNENA